MRTADQVIGTIVGGRYRIIEELGRGGMAVVYRVQNTRTSGLLALKRGIARNAKQSTRRQALLSREYHTLCQLAHPCIIEVYDYGVDEHGPYYVMELLDGGDFDRGGPLPFRDACALLRDVASSLAILHARGLIHRDVSTRNVRRTADGRAKLIDFGTMASMGTSLDVVGTAPFIAPEVLQLQALDARADLFALGALGYRLLTGRHAYPARRIKDLNDTWRSRPLPPSRLVPDIPAAVSDLVMQLLALDRNARPHGAAEVISRLCASADLPIEDHDAVAHAYLVTPTLVGRERALIEIRKVLLALARRDGGALAVEGAAGSGRSRLLDACSLEAKLLGAAVVRADAAEVEPGELSVVRELAAQLLELLPQQAAEASRLAHSVLAGVLDDLPHEQPTSVSAVMPERSLLVRELRDFVLALAKRHRLLIAVDNFDRCDELSQAVLAAIAYEAERSPLIVALVLDRGGDSAISPARRLLRSVGTAVPVEALGEAQTEALIRSLFGDVPNVALIAGRIHALAQGNPRTTMELAQHLVSKGLIRHRAGRFSLPETLDERELPPTLLSSLRQRLDTLSADALELCQVVYATEDDAIGLQDYPALTAHGDEARVLVALSELVAARVLCADAERYRFSQRGFVAAVGATLSAEQALALHARIAQFLAATGAEVLRRVHHLLRSGGETDAVDLIASLDLMVVHVALPLLERVVACADRLEHPARHRLRMALLVEAQALPDIACFAANAAPLIAQLDRDSGLARYRQLEHVPAADRLARALAETQQQYAAAPEHARGYPVTEAIPHLARLYSLHTSIALWTFDERSWDPVPSLAPLAPLSPAIDMVMRLADGAKLFLQGRFVRSTAIYHELLERISQPDRGGLPEIVHDRIRVGLHLLLGLRYAGIGLDDAEEHARVLDANRMYRVSAWRVRQVLNLARGDTREAQRCMRRAELLQLQMGGEQYALAAAFGVELPSYALAGDMAGLRTAVEHLTPMAERIPGWRALLILGRSRLRQLEGDPGGALELLLPAFELAPAGKHWGFVLLAAFHVELLVELERGREAIAVGQGYLDRLERDDLVASYSHHLSLRLAIALSGAGQPEAARAMVEAVIAELERQRSRGLAAGIAYETAARVALAAADRERFQHAAELCAREFGRYKNPVLVARFTRLVSEARTQGTAPVHPTPLDGLTSEHSYSDYAHVRSRIDECDDRSDRARCALTILLQHTESFAGYLYGVAGGDLHLLAALPDRAPEPELEQWLEEWSEAELAALARHVVTERGGSSRPRPKVRNHHVDREGRRLEAMTLIGTDAIGERIAAVLVMHVPSPARVPHDRALLNRVASELIAHGDVEGIALEEVVTAHSEADG